MTLSYHTASAEVNTDLTISAQPCALLNDVLSVFYIIHSSLCPKTLPRIKTPVLASVSLTYLVCCYTSFRFSVRQEQVQSFLCIQVDIYIFKVYPIHHHLPILQVIINPSRASLTCGFLALSSLPVVV